MLPGRIIYYALRSKQLFVPCSGFLSKETNADVPTVFLYVAKLKRACPLCCASAPDISTTRSEGAGSRSLPEVQYSRISVLFFVLRAAAASPTEAISLLLERTELFETPKVTRMYGVSKDSPGVQTFLMTNVVKCRHARRYVRGHTC